MKTIVILNGKGGVGKSNLTRHLAVAADLENPGCAVLCDTDPQSSLADWWNARTSETPPLAVLGVAEFAVKAPALADRFGYLFLDTAAADALPYADILKAADLIVIPVNPSPDDVRSLNRLTLPVVKASGRPFVFVMSKAKLGTQLLVATMAALSEHGAVCQTIIQQREPYAKAAFTGSTVLEDEPKGKAADEIRELWYFVKSRLDEQTKPIKPAKGLLHV
ncbi:MAG: ArsA-related P-loop ATPase [Trichococcus flocculiformis]